MRRPSPAALLLALALAGCVVSVPGVPGDGTPKPGESGKPSQAGKLAVTAHGVLAGTQRGVIAEQSVVIATQAEYDAFLALLKPQGEAPKIDFARHRLLALYRKDTVPGCQMEFQAFERGAAIEFGFTEPPRGLNCGMKLQPPEPWFGLASLPKGDKPVTGAAPFKSVPQPTGTPLATPTPTPSDAATPKAVALAGSYELNFDPPYMGDSGLTPTGAHAKAIVIPLMLATREGRITGQGNWCPSDFCVTTTVAGTFTGPEFVLTLADGPFGGKPGLTLKGSVGANHLVAGEVVGEQPPRKFTLVLIRPTAVGEPDGLPTPAPTDRPPTPTPTASAAAPRGLAGTWTPAGPDTSGPVTVGACYPTYKTYAFEDADGDGKAVTMRVGMVQGGGAYMIHDTEDLKGDRVGGDRYAFQGTVTPGGFGGDGPAKAVTYELTLDGVRQRLTGQRTVQGQAPEAVTLGPVEAAPRPAEGCGPPPP